MLKLNFHSFLPRKENIRMMFSNKSNTLKDFSPRAWHTNIFGHQVVELKATNQTHFTRLTLHLLDSSQQHEH